MSYLTYDRYIELGGGTYGEDAFEGAEFRAELILDDMTLGRLHEVDWSRWEARVERAMLITIETLPALEDSFKSATAGAQVSYFSNSVTSMNIKTADIGEDAALAALVAELQAILPVELTSRCVRWNDAGGC